MISSMQAAVIKKDVRFITTNKNLFTGLVVVSLIFSVFLPLLFILLINYVPDETSDLQTMLDMIPQKYRLDSTESTLILLIMNYIMPVFFAIIPIMASSTMAASSFVGEKEKRTLETLLYSPLSIKEVFHAKIYASFFVSMAVSFCSFAVMLIVSQVSIFLTRGALIPPGVGWLAMMLAVSPATSLLSITLIVSGSAKAKTIEESYQRSVFLVLPFILLVIGQFTGLILVNAWYLLGLGAVLGAAAALMMKRSMRNFTYETLLR